MGKATAQHSTTAAAVPKQAHCCLRQQRPSPRNGAHDILQEQLVLQECALHHRGLLVAPDSSLAVNRWRKQTCVEWGKAAKERRADSGAACCSTNHHFQC